MTSSQSAQSVKRWQCLTFLVLITLVSPSASNASDDICWIDLSVTALTEEQKQALINRICTESLSDPHLGKAGWDGENLYCDLGSMSSLQEKRVYQFLVLNASYTSMYNLIPQSTYKRWPGNSTFPICQNNPQHYEDTALYQVSVMSEYCLTIDSKQQDEVFLGMFEGSCNRYRGSPFYSQRTKAVTIESENTQNCSGYAELSSSESGQAGDWIKMRAMNNQMSWQQPRKRNQPSLQACCEAVSHHPLHKVKDEYLYISYNPETKECSYGEAVNREEKESGNLRTFLRH